MFKCRHSTLILISGLLWFGVGTSLLTLGLNFIIDAARNGAISGLHHYPLMDLLAPYVSGGENAALFLIAIGLAVGYCKTRFVLSKSVVRVTTRIRSLPDPASLFTIYNAPYYLLIIGMICLGISLKFIGLATDIRGVIDTTIGSALINGAVLYFRSAKAIAVQ